MSTDTLTYPDYPTECVHDLINEIDQLLADLDAIANATEGSTS